MWKMFVTSNLLTEASYNFYCYNVFMNFRIDFLQMKLN